MELVTENLKIIALNEEQFALLIRGIDKLEDALGIDVSSEPLDGPAKTALQWLYDEGMNDRENFIWYTSWQLVLKSMNMLIGSACFLGKPGADGRVELSYGIHKFCRLRGYEEEVLSAICGWAFERGVKEIVSGSDMNDYAAQKILEVCGFESFGASEAEGICFWRRSAAQV
ncbi:MAG: GNAT family N-acetyltransferase [Spirochaetia bacterium]|jgi:RimJ/RimL family protein N-acetyltransferase|nr:GNAT family N-acetyltransferase [Spirochaetia bacterium]